MEHRILLADDSQTIHKVITYTFMNSPFEVEIASTVEEVEQKLSEGTYDIILLDFGLDESLDGYTLAKQVNDRSKDSSIIVLLNSFDIVDDTRLQEVGVREKIAKPFESQELITICQEIVAAPQKENLLALSEDGGDGENWELKGPPPRRPQAVDEEQLKQELTDWSIEIPPVISDSPDGESAIMAENLPPIIDPPQPHDEGPSLPEPIEEASSEELLGDATIQLEIPDEIRVSQGKIPNADELEYPSLKVAASDFFDNQGDAEEVQPILVSDLNLETEFEEEDGDGQGHPPTITEEESAGDQAKTMAIERTISKEVDPKDFWTLDEKVGNDLNIDEIVEKLRPFIEEKIQKHCQKTIEKVAWEIIPELAENIIKKEIQEIKKSVIN